MNEFEQLNTTLLVFVTYDAGRSLMLDRVEYGTILQENSVAEVLRGPPNHENGGPR